MIIVRLVGALFLIAESARLVSDRELLLDLAHSFRAEGEARIARERDRRMLSKTYDAAPARFEAAMRVNSFTASALTNPIDVPSIKAA